VRLGRDSRDEEMFTAAWILAEEQRKTKKNKGMADRKNVVGKY
jgi:hypothetical protein